MVDLIYVFCGKAGECISKFYVFTNFAIRTPTSLTTYTFRDIEILGWCPAGPVLPHGEKVAL